MEYGSCKLPKEIGSLVLPLPVAGRQSRYTIDQGLWTID